MKLLKILIIHGPNLNMLGLREPEIYGSVTLEEINNNIRDYADNNNIEVKIYQSNIEGEIVDFIQNNRNYNGIVINPAAYTHTSIAISDAIKAVNIPAVEVHISNIYSRENYRRKSYVAPVCVGQITGFGQYSYILGLIALQNHLLKQK